MKKILFPKDEFDRAWNKKMKKLEIYQKISKLRKQLDFMNGFCVCEEKYITRYIKKDNQSEIVCADCSRPIKKEKKKS